jgi:type II secretory pathway component PulF
VAKLTEGVMISALRETGRVLALHKDTNSKVMISIYFPVIRIFNCVVVSYLNMLVLKKVASVLESRMQAPRCSIPITDSSTLLQICFEKTGVCWLGCPLV